MTTTTVESAVTCPICDNRFAAVTVGSFTVGEKESDFCPRYLGTSPLPFFVVVCAACGYAGYESDFAPIQSDRLRHKLKQTLARMEPTGKMGRSRADDNVAPAPQGSLCGVDKYRRLAVLASYRGDRNLDVADAYLRASWCARVDAAPGEGYCQTKAAKHFELALQAGEPRPKERPVLAYLIGELHRRLGQNELASTWLNLVEPDANNAPDAWLARWVAAARSKLACPSGEQNALGPAEAPA